MFVKFLIYYLLPWSKNNQWHNESHLRTKAENMGQSNNKMQICDIKNWRKIDFKQKNVLRLELHTLKVLLHKQ